MDQEPAEKREWILPEGPTGLECFTDQQSYARASRLAQ
jgi:hypothetical protein